MTEKFVNRGDKIPTERKTWNRILSKSRETKSKLVGKVQPMPELPAAGVMSCVVDATGSPFDGQTVPVGTILGTSQDTPTADRGNFQPTLSGQHNSTDRPVITLDPFRSDAATSAVVRVAVTGVALLRVVIGDVEHQFATAADDHATTGNAMSASEGEFKLLWRHKPAQDGVELWYVGICCASGEPSEETDPEDPEDPANNDSCCRFGQLFICELPEGISREILCSAVNPPIDGEKSWKVRFKKGDDIHDEILTLPCTEEFCDTLNLDSIEIDGTTIGRVNYGNFLGCCPCNNEGFVATNDILDTAVWSTGDGMSKDRSTAYPIIASGSNSWVFSGEDSLGGVLIPGGVEGKFRRWNSTQQTILELTIDDIINNNPDTNSPTFRILFADIDFEVHLEPRSNDGRAPRNESHEYVIIDDQSQFGPTIVNTGVVFQPGDRIKMTNATQQWYGYVEVNGNLIYNTPRRTPFAAVPEDATPINCEAVWVGLSASNSTRGGFGSSFPELVEYSEVHISNVRAYIEPRPTI